MWAPDAKTGSAKARLFGGGEAGAAPANPLISFQSQPTFLTYDCLHVNTRCFFLLEDIHHDCDGLVLPPDTTCYEHQHDYDDYHNIYF